MPLYKPKFLTPGDESKTVDLQNSNSDGIEFSCVVDGNETVKKYKVDIWSMTSDDVHFTKTVVLSSSTIPPYPFFPINEKNEYNLFQFYLSQTELSNSNIVNTTTPYKWQISMWVDGNESSETPDTVSCEEVFYANKTPTLSLSYKSGTQYETFDDTPLTSKVISFKGTYSQAQNIPLQCFGWYIKNNTTGEVLINTIDDGKMIYSSSSNIVLSYDGFLNDETYLVRCKAVTQNGAEVEAEQEFQISYDTYDVTSDFTITTLPKETGNLLSWGNVSAITGNAFDRNDIIVPEDELNFSHNYPVEDQNSIALEDGIKVIFEQGTDDVLDIPEDSTFVYSFQCPEKDDKVLLEISGSNDSGLLISRKLEIIDSHLVYTVDNGETVSTQTSSSDYVLNRYSWFIVVLYPIENDVALMRITNIRTVGSLYPSTTLFPSTSVMPKFGTWEGE